jgi:multisubunit Na+/H+ antiporter MnhG subunit
MKFDLRTPVGILFTIYGLLLAGYGLVSDKEQYTRSMGINVNLWWGLVMLVFGVVMWFFAIRASRPGK